MDSLLKQIVLVAEDETFLVGLVHHVAIDKSLVDPVLALRHFPYRLYLRI